MELERVRSPDSNTSARRVSTCRHCGSPNPKHSKSDFCCLGCEGVFRLLSQRGLADQYYSLRGSRTSERQVVDDVQDGFAIRPTTYREVSGGWEFDLYVAGVHCVACVWLLEKLSEFVPGVQSSRLNLSQSVLTVWTEPQLDCRPLLREIRQFGYRPHFMGDQTREQLAQSEDRREVIRLGIAGALAGNLMLMAVPLYAGATGGFALWFRWISAGLYLPVVFWSAWPIIRGAWKALPRLTIDLPISFSLIFGGVFGYVELIRGGDEIYFDSLASFVFFLLSSRWLLRKGSERAAQSTRLEIPLIPQWMEVFEPSIARYAPRLTSDVAIGNVVRVPTGAYVGIDGLLLSREGEVDRSHLTGESQVVRIRQHDLVAAGSRNLGAPIEIQATTTQATSRIQTWFNDAFRMAERVPLHPLADQAAGWFLVLLVSLVTGLFAYWGVIHHEWGSAVQRVLAVTLVACPCILALAPPLVYQRALAKAATEGLMIKSPLDLQKSLDARWIAFDKTGTLTEGKFRVAEFRQISTKYTLAELWNLVASLERESKHPIARPMLECAWSQGARISNVSDWAHVMERPGVGVFGEWRGQEYSIVPLRPGVHALREGQVVLMEFDIRDAPRPELIEVLQDLKAQGFQLAVLSGDRRDSVEAMLNLAGVHTLFDEIHAGFTPEEKANWMKTHPAILVGDGANDVLAMKHALAGIATKGGIEASLKVSSAFLLRDSLRGVVSWTRLSKSTQRLIITCFGFSAFYNLCSTSAAVAGLITPLVAAILMPISAFTVLTISRRVKL